MWKRMVCSALVLLAIQTTCFAGEETMSVEDQIMTLEEKAIQRWLKGDPYGFLEMTDTDYSYFDPALEKRIDGLDAMSEYYKPVVGKIHADYYKFVDPRVQVIGDVAILTYNFYSWDKNSEEPTEPLWNSTEIYARSGDSWKLRHSHWSFWKSAKPE